VADSTIGGLSELLQNQVTNSTELPVELSAQTYRLKIGTLKGFFDAGYQPINSGLTSIAALSTTSFGRSLLTQPDAAAARATLGSAIARQTFSDAPATIAPSTTVLAQTGTLTAARVVTLPAANAVLPGVQILILDESGTATIANKISVSRAGSDTVNGVTSVDAIVSGYASATAYSDGVSKWTVLYSKSTKTAMSISSLSFSRPANTVTYVGSASSPVVVSDSTTATTQTYLKFTNAIDTAGGITQLLRADLKKSSPSLTNASFRLWLYNVQPTIGNDAGVFALTSSGLLGYVDFVNFVSGGSGSNVAIAMVPDLNIALQGATGARDVYGVLTATSGYTPVSAENISIALYLG
jgi:hypothetical protein